MKVLIAGWFSFDDMGATAGDLLCRDVLAEWLQNARIPFEVAVAAPFTEGVAWESVDPGGYSHLIFVCGPLGNGWPVADLLEQFQDCELIGLNLTMLDDLENWNPFTLLLERDSNRTTRPDLTFLSRNHQVPIAGLILADHQKEYRERAQHELANAAIQEVLALREAAVVKIDTRLDHNRTGQRTAAEIESLIARMDLVVTTRLHGTVLALKNGVPALVIDPIAGGHKVHRQVKTLKWPICFTANQLVDSELERAFDFCLTEEARTLARHCSQQARQSLSGLQMELLRQLQRNPQEV